MARTPSGTHNPTVPEICSVNPALKPEHVMAAVKARAIPIKDGRILRGRLGDAILGGFKFLRYGDANYMTAEETQWAANR